MLWLGKTPFAGNGYAHVSMAVDAERDMTVL
jgi:hypothetical protein